MLELQQNYPVHLDLKFPQGETIIINPSRGIGVNLMPALVIGDNETFDLNLDLIYQIAKL